MSLLTINGTEYFIKDDGTPAMTPVQIGEKTRAFAGGLRSTLQNAKREWTVTTTEIDDATYTALIADAAAAAGTPTCGGDMIVGGAVPCVVIITGDQPLYDGGVHKQNVTLNVCEV